MKDKKNSHFILMEFIIINRNKKPLVYYSYVSIPKEYILNNKRVYFCKTRLRVLLFLY